MKIGDYVEIQKKNTKPTGYQEDVTDRHKTSGTGWNIEMEPLIGHTYKITEIQNDIYRLDCPRASFGREWVWVADWLKPSTKAKYTATKI